MALRQVLLSVIDGPGQARLFIGANNGCKLHFVCRDEQGVSGFDLYVEGKIKPDNDGTGKVVFAAKDATGLLWALVYDPHERTGNMMRNFGKSD